MRESKEILKLMTDRQYNRIRPSTMIIDDLIEVIIYLGKRIETLEKKRNK